MILNVSTSDYSELTSKIANPSAKPHIHGHKAKYVKIGG